VMFTKQFCGHHFSCIKRGQLIRIIYSKDKTRLRNIYLIDEITTGMQPKNAHFFFTPAFYSCILILVFHSTQK